MFSEDNAQAGSDNYGKEVSIKGQSLMGPANSYSYTFTYTAASSAALATPAEIRKVTVAGRAVFAKPEGDINEIKIPDGCADISRQLGLAPSQTLWDYEWLHNEESGLHWPEDGLTHCGDHEDILLLSRGEATGLSLKLQDGYLEYLRRYAGVTNVIEVTEDQALVSQYPAQSVIVQARKKSRADQGLKETFKDKVFCSWLPGSDVQADTRAMGGKTLISAEQCLFFNSKARIFAQAEGSGYNVAPFVLVNSWDELETRLAELQETARDLGIEEKDLKLWVKFDNLAGGEGVKPYRPASDKLDDIKAWVREICEQVEKDGDAFRPLVIDLDIGQLPEVKNIVANFCVQAVVGPEIGVTGVTLQRTRDGVYAGGSVPMTAEDKAFAEEAKAWVMPVLQAAQEQGYRGYAGIDVMMTQGVDGQLRGYVIEMNARLCGSTPLLAMAHWVEREASAEPAVVDFTEDNLAIKDFKTLTQKFNKLMYKGRESGFEGIVPVHINVDKQGVICGVKMIAVANSPERLQKLEKRYQKAFAGVRRVA